ncbi:MAG TPA: hypothetical protein VGN20_06675 [Mucilaginibacter sp.]|jgi:hypothetical protein
MAVRIICIKRDEGNYENPYVAIDHLEWVNERIKVNGITDRTKIYDWIKYEKGEAYVLDQHGNKAYLIPALSPLGNKYVKTVNDETGNDCLLYLPECTLC